MAEDPYIVLGVAKGSPHAEVRKAYRKLAKELHPDKNPNNKAAEEKFKKVSASFTFLDDEERKAKYDRGEIDADGNPKFGGFGGGGFGGGSGGFAGGDPFGPGGPFAGMNRGGQKAQAGGFGSPEFEDFFGDLFGAGIRNAKSSSGVRGNDVNSFLEVETIDIINGAKKRLKINNKDVEINIPVGSQDGKTLRLKGKGMHGKNGGPNGDLLVKLKIIPDNRFRIEDKDVHSNVFINLKTAIFGGKIEIETPSGLVAMSVKPNAYSGQILRLKGRGVQQAPVAGDLYIHIYIGLPEGDNSELGQLIEQWSLKDAAPK